MKKDAFYFPHFANARHDRKIKRVTKELGIEGYGIYFMLLEVLREQQDFRYPISDIDLLADEFGTSLAKVEVVLKKYDLFQIDECNNFFSIKQVYYLQPYLEKSNNARLAAQKRWQGVKDANADANALQEHCIGNASKVKESKLKETKEKKSKIEFADKSANYDLMVEVYFNFYESLFNFKPTFQAIDGKMIKEIEAKIINICNQKSLVITEKLVVGSFTKVLDYASKDKWLKENFLLKNINSQFNKIINYGTKQEGQRIELDEETAKYFG
jgi:hypothetical protein